MVEGARLESVYTSNRIVGSNPTLSAINLYTHLIRVKFILTNQVLLIIRWWRETEATLSNQNLFTETISKLAVFLISLIVSLIFIITVFFSGP